MISKFSMKKPLNKNQKFIENFFIKKGLKLLVDLSKKKTPSINQMIINEPYIPELDDLYNLYQYVLINKRTTILEFGSGWSSLIFSLALNELANKFSNEVIKLRRNNPFELFVIENEKKYLDITKNRILKFNKYLKIKKPINVKYFLDDNTQLRAAFYRSLSRPGFGETAPIADISENEGGGQFRGSMGNPDLEPYEASNLDVSYEYYDDGLVLTAGVFYKDIENTIYPRVLANQTVGGLFFTELETYANAGSSSIFGIELNLFAELDDYLPIDGFFAAINTTLSDGESDFDTGLGQFTIPFRKLSEENANLSLGYDKGKIDARLAVNYRSSYLDYLGDEGEDLLDSDFGYGFIRYTDDYLSYDLTAKYKYSDNLSFKFEGKNLGNRPEYYYWNTSDRLSQYDEYGYTLSFGIRYSY